MTIILSNYTTQFKSFNLKRNSDIYCLVNITAQHLKNKLGDEYIKIKYDYNYSEKHPKIDDNLTPDTHPFYKQIIDIKEHQDGDIMKYNLMIKSMLDMLFMRDQELSKHIGKTYLDDYKKGIILSFVNFLD